MPKLKLTYFDFNGSRGETARLALSIGGVPFEDARVKPADFPAMRNDLPYGALPILEVDGEVVAQSNGINRFVGKLAGLYPADPLQAALCDEAMDAVEDVTVRIGPSMRIKDEAEKKRMREELTDGAISFFLRGLGKRLEARGGEWFADKRLTVADLKVYVWSRYLASGTLDYVPADLADRVAPNLVAHRERVKSHSGVKAYYAGRGVAL